MSRLIQFFVYISIAFAPGQAWSGPTAHEDLADLYAQYTDVEAPLIHEYKDEKCTLTPLEIIAKLPDVFKPRLPEGYIWTKTAESKMFGLMRHRVLAEMKAENDFRIHIFGPDKRGMVQYLVVENGVTVQGFAMTFSESFTDELRDDYPIAAKAYHKGDLVYWRGHILDYRSTQR